jgi:hypothetical protein
MGNVKTGKLPMPKGQVAFSCDKGKIPVMLRLVRRRSGIDRHILIISVLVEPANDNTA